MALGEGNLQGLAAGLMAGYQMFRQGKADRNAEDDRQYNRTRQEKLDTQNQANTEFNQNLQTQAETRAQGTYDAEAGLRAYHASPEYTANLKAKDTADVEGTKARTAGSIADTKIKEEELTPANIALRQREREGKLDLQKSQIAASQASVAASQASTENSRFTLGQAKAEAKRRDDLRTAGEAVIQPYMTAVDSMKRLYTDPTLVQNATIASSIINKMQSGQGNAITEQERAFLSNKPAMANLFNAKYGNMATKLEGVEVDEAMSNEFRKVGLNVPAGSKLGQSRFDGLQIDKNDGTIAPQLKIQAVRPDGTILEFSNIHPDGQGGYAQIAPVTKLYGEDLEQGFSSMLHLKDQLDQRGVQGPEDIDKIKLHSLQILQDGKMDAKELDDMFGTNPARIDLKDVLNLMELAKVNGYNDTPEMAKARIQPVLAWAKSVYKDQIPPELVTAIQNMNVGGGSTAPASAKDAASAAKAKQQAMTDAFAHGAANVTLPGGANVQITEKVTP